MDARLIDKDDGGHVHWQSCLFKEHFGGRPLKRRKVVSAFLVVVEDKVYEGRAEEADAVKEDNRSRWSGNGIGSEEPRF